MGGAVTNVLLERRHVGCVCLDGGADSVGGRGGDRLTDQDRRVELHLNDSVCYRVAMRLHISLDDAMVRALDGRVGQRQRSTFIAAAIARALDDERRWEEIEGTIGALSETDHVWDADPASWVREQRSGDASRVG